MKLNKFKYYITGEQQCPYCNGKGLREHDLGICMICSGKKKIYDKIEVSYEKIIKFQKGYNENDLYSDLKQLSDRLNKLTEQVQTIINERISKNIERN